MGKIRARSLHVIVTGGLKDDLAGRDKWLIAFMDDSSRLITCYGKFDRPTTGYAIRVLEQGFADYGVPREILTDNGSQFAFSMNPETADHTF